MRFISLALSNFQAHEDVTISLDNQIVVIRGATDVGKSAVLRALRWVCLNDIAGDEFIRHGAKRCEVALTVCHNKKFYRIVRRRGGGDNKYELDGKVYRAFGSTVPADIVALLNVNAINFQSQHDAPYWFSETAGEVSRQLNAIIDLNVIDTALSNVASEVRKSQERKEVSEERLTEIKNEYEQLLPQKNRVEQFEKLVAYQKRFSECEEDCNKLLRLGTKIRDGRDTAQTTSDKAADAAALLQFANTFRKADIDWTSLQELLESIQHYGTTSQPPPDFSSVINAFDTWIKLVEDCNALAVFPSRGYKILADLEQLETRAAKRKETFHEKIKGARCPICQKPLP